MIDLWVPLLLSPCVSHHEVPDVRTFLVGPDWTCEGIDTWDDPEPAKVLEELSRECGLLWGCEEGTPIQKEIWALNDLRKETDTWCLCMYALMLCIRSRPTLCCTRKVCTALEALPTSSATSANPSRTMKHVKTTCVVVFGVRLHPTPVVTDAAKKSEYQ